jgi:hypothetical protein
VSGGSSFVSPSSVSENKLQGKCPKPASHSIVPSSQSALIFSTSPSSVLLSNKHTNLKTDTCERFFQYASCIWELGRSSCIISMMEGRLPKEFFGLVSRLWLETVSPLDQSKSATQATLIYKKQHSRRIPRRQPLRARTLQAGANRCAYIGNSSPPSRPVGF